MAKGKKVYEKKKRKGNLLEFSFEGSSVSTLKSVDLSLQLEYTHRISSLKKKKKKKKKSK